MDWRSHIVADPSSSGGRPVIRGTQIAVESIVSLLAGGATNAEVLATYPYLSELDICACLAYAGEFLQTHTVAGADVEPAVNPPASMEPMKVALRVLSAYAEKHKPSPADVAALMRLAGPEPPGTSPDEFACDALQRIMRDRAEARKALTVG